MDTFDTCVIAVLLAAVVGYLWGVLAAFREPRRVECDEDVVDDPRTPTQYSDPVQASRERGQS